MSIFGKKTELSKGDRELVQACAKDMFGKVWRAEGKAQAKLAVKDLVPKLEAMLAIERGQNAKKLAVLAENLNRLMVIVSVLQDLAVSSNLELSHIPHDDHGSMARREKFAELCTLKEIKMTALPNQPKAAAQAGKPS